MKNKDELISIYWKILFFVLPISHYLIIPNFEFMSKIENWKLWNSILLFFFIGTILILIIIKKTNLKEHSSKHLHFGFIISLIFGVVTGISLLNILASQTNFILAVKLLLILLMFSVPINHIHTIIKKAKMKELFKLDKIPSKEEFEKESKIVMAQVYPIIPGFGIGLLFCVGYIYVLSPLYVLPLLGIYQTMNMSIMGINFPGID